MTTPPVLILCAVPQESALIEQTLLAPTVLTERPFRVVGGTIGSVRTVICVGGVGKANAAAATAVMVERYFPQMVINVGCAGAYARSGLAVGQLAIADSELLGDEGVLLPSNWQDLAFMNIPSVTRGTQRYYNRIPLSKHAAETAVQLAEYHGVPLKRGAFVTVSTCSGSRARGDELTARYGAIAESMEGGAVAQICLRYGVDCLEIRGISNLVVDRDLKGWDIPRAVEAAQRFVLKFLERMERPESSSGAPSGGM